MQEKLLLKIALITSLVGILIIFFISDNIEISQSNIEKITLDNKDEMVKVKGRVSKVIDTEKVTILNILQPSEITVVLFKQENEASLIKENNEVEIIGKVDEYNGELEIIAQRARIIS